MVLVQPTERWLNVTIRIPWIGRVSRNGKEPVDVSTEAARWLILNNFATEPKAKVQPSGSSDFPMPEGRPIDAQGAPAYGHLSSDGHFATPNPAGSINDKIVESAEMPPSVERLQQEGKQPTLEITSGEEAWGHTSSDNKFATKNPAGVRVFSGDMTKQEVTAQETPPSVLLIGDPKPDPVAVIPAGQVSNAHLSSEGTFATENPAGVILPGGALEDIVVSTDIPPSLARIQGRELPPQTPPEEDMLFKLVNDLHYDAKKLSEAIKGVGIATAEKIVAARPLLLPILKRMLTDRQWEAAKAWAQRVLSEQEQNPIPVINLTPPPPSEEDTPPPPKEESLPNPPSEPPPPEPTPTTSKKTPGGSS